MTDKECEKKLEALDKLAGAAKRKKRTEFDGFDWYELVEYFDLEQENKEVFANAGDLTVPESVERVFYVGYQKVSIETSDEEEVGLVKLENFLTKHLISESERADEVRAAVNDFIDKLIEDGYRDATVSDDDVYIYKAFRNIKDNQKFGVWFTNNIRAFWN